MEELLHMLTMLMVLLPLWAILAAPILLVFFVAARLMRRRSFRSRWAITALALAFALVAAPVPTPIITVFVPHGYALLDRSYYDSILHGPGMFSGLWRWIVPSLIITFGAALALMRRYMRPTRFGPEIEHP